MVISIRRKRWVIIRDGTDIFCGLARQFHFKPVSELGNAPVKTYLSKAKAISAFKKSWNDDFNNGRYEAVEIVESIEKYDF